MRKATSRRSQTPTAASLRAMPEVDFERSTRRRNPFAGRIAREGIELMHDEPTRESLAAVREVDYSVARARRNPYASRAAEALGRMEAGKGRPPQGREVGPTPARSVRLPAAVWKALEVEAQAERTTVHALLRRAVTLYVAGAARAQGTNAVDNGLGAQAGGWSARQHAAFEQVIAEIDGAPSGRRAKARRAPREGGRRGRPR